MKIKNTMVWACTLVLIASGCGSLAGSRALTQNYANAIPPAEQLIVGMFKLDGTDLAVTSKQAATLLPLWQAYHALLTSNAAAPAEVEATLTAIEEALTAEQLQAIANMKLTGADQTALQQQQTIESSEASKTSTSSAVSGPEGGGFAGPAGSDVLGLGSAPLVASSSSKTTTAVQVSADSPQLVKALIMFLQNKVRS